MSTLIHSLSYRWFASQLQEIKRVISSLVIA